jgi:hypothetical protein
MAGGDAPPLSRRGAGLAQFRRSCPRRLGSYYGGVCHARASLGSFTTSPSNLALYAGDAAIFFVVTTAPECLPPRALIVVSKVPLSRTVVVGARSYKTPKLPIAASVRDCQAHSISATLIFELQSSKT